MSKARCATASPRMKSAKCWFRLRSMLAFRAASMHSASPARRSKRWRRLDDALAKEKNLKHEAGDHWDRPGCRGKPGDVRARRPDGAPQKVHRTSAFCKSGNIGGAPA